MNRYQTISYHDERENSLICMYNKEFGHVKVFYNNRKIDTIKINTIEEFVDIFIGKLNALKNGRLTH